MSRCLSPLRCNALSLVLLLGACASHAPEPLPYGGATVPVSWIEPAPTLIPDGAAQAQWWRQFGDAQLVQLVDAAMQANTEVNAAAAALRRARALRDVSVAASLPLLGGSVQAQRTRDGGGATGNLFDAAFDAGWETDVFGALRHGAQASEAQARAAESTLTSVRVSIAAEVAIDYIGLRAVQRRAALTEQNVAQQQQSLQLAQWRERAGLANALDVLQARSALAQTQAQQPVLQGSAAQLTHALAVLTGRTPETLQGLQQVAAIPRAPAGMAIAIPAQVLRQRPDVAAAEQQVLVAAEQVAEADAQRHPSVRLRASVQWSALTLGSLGSGEALRSLTAGLTQPLLDHGQRNAQLAAAQAAFDASQHNYRGAVLAALRDVEDGLSSLNTSGERLQRLHAAAAAAEEAAALARQRYASGLVDFQVVLDTQRALLAAQDSAAAAEGEVATAQVRLYKALGGAWSTKENGG